MIETINHVNREVAKELDLPEELVALINSFYWKEGVKKAVTSGEHTSIWVRNFGTITTSRNKVNISIIKLIREIRRFQESNKEYKKKTKEEYIEDRMIKLKVLLERRNDIAKAYKANEDRKRKK